MTDKQLKTLQDALNKNNGDGARAFALDLSMLHDSFKEAKR